MAQPPEWSIAAIDFHRLLGNQTVTKPSKLELFPSSTSTQASVESSRQQAIEDVGDRGIDEDYSCRNHEPMDVDDDGYIPIQETHRSATFSTSEQASVESSRQQAIEGRDDDSIKGIAKAFESFDDDVEDVGIDEDYSCGNHEPMEVDDDIQAIREPFSSTLTIPDEQPLEDNPERTRHPTDEEPILTDRDLDSLQGENWLTLNVVDWFLFKMLDPFPHHKFLRGTAVSQLIEKSPANFLKHLGGFQFIVGPYLRRDHFSLVVIGMQEKTVYFYDPVLEEGIEMNTILQAVRQQFADPEQWQIHQLRYFRQSDKYNCGVFIVLCADYFFCQKPTTVVYLAKVREEMVKIIRKSTEQTRLPTDEEPILTDTDKDSLLGENWLSLNVVDWFLFKMLETFPHHKFLRGAAMSKLIEDSPVDFLKNLGDFQFIVGPYLRKDHFSLVVIGMPEKTVYFYDPEFEDGIEMNAILHAVRQQFADPEQWQIHRLPYFRQSDKYNCGVFIVLCADSMFCQESATAVDLVKMREEMAKIVLKSMLERMGNIFNYRVVSEEGLK